MKEENTMKKVTRRDWVGLATTAGAGVCLCGCAGGCATFSKVGTTPAVAPDTYSIEGNKLTVQLDKTPALANVGGAVKIINASLPTPLIIARNEEAKYVVVSLLCPHRNVEVEYQHTEKLFRCASLGHSKFATDGKLIKGLTKKSLSGYPATLDPADKNRLVVTL
jgi:hypothetical protein